MDQTHRALGKPVGQISYVFKWDVLILAVAGQRMPARTQPADISQSFAAGVQPSAFEGVLRRGEASLQIPLSKCLVLGASTLFSENQKGKGALPEVQTIPSAGKTCERTLQRLGEYQGLTEVDLNIKKA